MHMGLTHRHLKISSGRLKRYERSLLPSSSLQLIWRGSVENGMPFPLPVYLHANMVEQASGDGIHTNMVEQTSSHEMLQIDPIIVSTDSILTENDLQAIQAYIAAGKNITETVDGETLSSIRKHCVDFGDKIPQITGEGSWPGVNSKPLTRLVLSDFLLVQRFLKDHVPADFEQISESNPTDTQKEKDRTSELNLMTLYTESILSEPKLEGRKLIRKLQELNSSLQRVRIAFGVRE